MANTIPITVVVRDYDHVGPLAKGDVVPEGIALSLARTTPIYRFGEDPALQGGEMSMSKYLIRLSKGDRSIVGLPIFVMRAFRHRCFFVRRESGLHSFKDLEGKRVGTNGWPDTGNTWSRAALRSEGVRLDRIAWWVGPIDGSTDAVFGHKAATDVPDGINVVPPGKSLAGMVADGELDAMMVPWPPSNFYQPDSPIVRLFPNYPEVEKAYYQKVGFYPAHHVIGLRRDVFEANPWVAQSLYEAFERSRLLSQERRLLLTDVTPWSLPDLEETVATFGKDWQPNGVAANRAMIEAFCENQFAQGLVERKVDPEAVFADFEQGARG